MKVIINVCSTAAVWSTYKMEHVVWKYGVFENPVDEFNNPCHLQKPTSLLNREKTVNVVANIQK